MDYVDPYKAQAASYLNDLFQIWNSLNSGHEHYHTIDKELDKTIELLIELIKKGKK